MTARIVCNRARFTKQVNGLFLFGGEEGRRKNVAARTKNVVAETRKRIKALPSVTLRLKWAPSQTFHEIVGYLHKHRQQACQSKTFGFVIVIGRCQNGGQQHGENDNHNPEITRHPENFNHFA
jgi:hypothetical protein